MTRNKSLPRTAALILATILLVGGAVLSSCADNLVDRSDRGINAGIETSAGNAESFDGIGREAETTDPVGTPPSQTKDDPPASGGSDYIVVARDNKAIYTIVRPDNADEATVGAAVALKKMLTDISGVNFSIITDWVKPGVDPDAVSGYEILIGKTNRTASQNAQNDTDGSGWSVIADGGRIIINADCTADLDDAVDCFLSICSYENGETRMDLTKQKTVIFNYQDLRGKSLKVGSYNIKHGADAGLDMSVIAADITSLNLDIVGLQEIDQLTRRVGGMDTMKRLSEATGYKYYAFARAIDYQGGEYGTAVLSRYPIISFETHPLESAGYEARSAGHAVIEIEGVRIDFFNTHLSFEDKAIRKKQFAQLAELIADCRIFILTGDFNTADTSEFSVIANSELVNENKFSTFPSSQKGIDNIVISSNWEIFSSGVVVTGHSDHNLLWTEITFKGK